MALQEIWTLPIKTVSEANSTEHWHKRGLRHTLQHQWVSTIKNDLKKIYDSSNKPVTVILTRIAPRRLDSDNLTMCLKYVRDKIADICIPGHAMGKMDSHQDFIWDYRQEKGAPKQYAVIIEIISI